MHIPYLIIGAGPTGLGAAWRLDARGEHDWLLLEGGLVPGGLARSVVDEHGFTWDLGGHVQFSHYEMFDRLMDELLGVDGWLYHDRESWVWILDRFVPYPFQFNLHRLPESDAAASLRGLEDAAAAQTGAHAAAPPANFGEWIDRTFGAAIAELFMRPYNRKVWARDPELMDWRWIGDRVAVPDVDRVRENVRLGRDDVSWGPNNRFRFPRRGGTGAVWDALAAKLTRQDGARAPRLQFGSTVKHLDTSLRRVALADGREIGYDRLISTMPLDRLIAMSDLARDLRPAARDLEYSSTHVVGVGLHGAAPEALAQKCWMYFPEANCPFYRVTHFSHYSPNNVPDPSSQWSLMAEVSESVHRPVDGMAVSADVIRGLVATGLIDSEAQVHHVWHTRLEHGYPVPSLHRDRGLVGILSALEARDVLSRGRFGAWKYEVSNQDHSFAQGVEAIDAWLDGAEEETLRRPDVVNARRPPAPATAVRT
jgi:protoporphyrinogen oxidase